MAISFAIHWEIGVWRYVSTSFGSKVIRSLPFWMGAAFAIALAGLLISAWLNHGDLNLRRMLLTAVAFALVWSGAAAPVSAYFVRRSEGIPARSSQTRRMALFSLIWSVGFGCVGLFLLGCAGFAASCMSASNLQTSMVASVSIGGFLSVMALSS